MNNTLPGKRQFAVLLWLVISQFATQCHQNTGGSVTVTKNTGKAANHALKPASSFTDTLTIAENAAVFFYPDSVQLLRFKTISSTNVFESTTHESFFQMRNAKMVLNKYWPRIKIIEARNVRFLNFVKHDGTKSITDLDKLHDLYGLFLFSPQKQPQLCDMMNIDTALGFYFK